MIYQTSFIFYIVIFILKLAVILECNQMAIVTENLGVQTWEIRHYELLYEEQGVLWDSILLWVDLVHVDG